MSRTILALSLLLIVVSAPFSVSHGQSSHYTAALPQCGHWERNVNDFYAVNTCNSFVEITITSDSDSLWGEYSVPPKGNVLVGRIEEPGTVSVMTCPNGAFAVKPGGDRIENHYHGPYTCELR